KRIREFAKLCNTSPKTLRFYDKAGLLKADYIDPKNGYRYYSEEQADWFQKIMELKQIGFTLEEIRSNFANAEDKKILVLLRERETALMKELEKCRTMVIDCEERVKMAEMIENGKIYVRRMDEQQKIVVAGSERELTFSCRAEGIDICCEVFTEMFSQPEFINLKLKDIPTDISEERSVLVQQLEGALEELLEADISQLFAADDNLNELKTVLFRISNVSPDDACRLMNRLSGCFSDKTAFLWCAVDMEKGKNVCKLQIVGIY
ncbi:MAG: MerR family transcriptional regulator, partial [Eubacteriales bacterium]